LAAEKKGVSLDDESALAQLALQLNALFDTTHNMGQLPQVTFEGSDVSETIRMEAYAGLASQIAALPRVRQALLQRQRDFRKAPGLVTDGRDMGSVIFPDASLKIFLTATAEERARRRYQQLKRKGIDVSLKNLCDELAARDQRDQGRGAAPLKPAPDAVIIDTTQLSIEEVLQGILEKVSSVFAAHHGGHCC
jgi:cytidylate kinase